jgi:hypothetical protein
VFVTVVAAIAMFLTLASGPVSKASALGDGGYNFCTNAWLAPHGPGGDSCFAGDGLWGHIYMVQVTNHERAGCVNYTGWYYEFYASWNCSDKNSTKQIWLPADGGSYRGAIRNNNNSYYGHFDGYEACCIHY